MKIRDSICRLFDRPPKNPATAERIRHDDEEAEYYDELMDRAEQFHEECGDR